jgi:endonuclease-3
MPGSKETIATILFAKAQELHDKPRSVVPFTNIPESDNLLNNIEEYSHFFVCGCIMDRQIPAEKAWNIPYKISQECRGKNFQNFLSLSLDSLNAIFNEKRLHRFNAQMANNFYQALQIIHRDYEDCASQIWTKGQPDSRQVIERFEKFPGVGQKISTMATNILVREFKVPLRNTNEIDISVDSQIEKVFKRIGFVPVNASKQQIIEAAREIYPDYPGIIDSVVWEIGGDWCKSDFSACGECYLNEYCPKISIIADKEGKKVNSIPGRKNFPVHPLKKSNSDIKPGKYRPRFESIIQFYKQVIPDNFYLRFTSSKTNSIIKSEDLTDGVQYEIDDWGTRISVELSLNRSRLPHLQHKLIALSKKRYQDLPTPNVKDQGDWIRLQFFFDESTQPGVIANAMNNLIGQTYSEITSGEP